jgi:hypothetical protein
MAKNILPFHKKDAEAKRMKIPKDRRLRRFAFAPNWVRNEFIAWVGEYSLDCFKDSSGLTFSR